MQTKICISGFADEISMQFSDQLRVVNELGMRYVCIRTVDGESIAEYTPQKAEEKLKPALLEAGIGVSSLGSPIGKVNIDDEAAFQKQLEQLESLCGVCRVLNCRYIRVFSFFMPKNESPEKQRAAVLKKMRQLTEIAQRHGVVLLHENEKEIFGDTAARCRELLDEIGSPCFMAAYDAANFVQCGENALEAYELLKDKIAYIHIKDAVSESSENVLCGTGEGQIPEVLRRAVADGYRGFLTLEPHLVLFDALQSLETGDVTKLFKSQKAKDGADGYRMQYEALCAILRELNISFS